MAERRAIGAFLLMLSLSNRSLAEQVGDSVGAARVTMPQALETAAPYPPGGHGKAEVFLEILVDADGSVRSTKLLAGDEPFVSVVLVAAPHWRFRPARRDDKAVAAKIRFVVRFEPEGEPPAGTAPQQPVVERSGTATSDENPPSRRPSSTNDRDPRAPLEVTILGQKPELAVQSLGRSDVEQLPGAFGDPFRAIEALPGVVPIVSGMPFFFVRGAPPGNQGYFLDGVRVPLLFHLGMGTGVIHPALVDRVDLYSGGYPARFGRFAGAIVAAESNDPPPEYHAQGSLRLVDSGAYATVPLYRGALALGGRYSYTAALLSLFAPEVELKYWDYQIKATQPISRKDTVGVFAFGALDFLQTKDDNEPSSQVGTEFHRVDFRYQRRFSAQTRFQSALTLGWDKTLGGDVVAVRDRLLNLRTVFEHEFSPSYSWRIGADGGLDDFGVILPVPDSDEAKLIHSLPERTDTVFGIWSDVAWQPTPEVRVIPGLRFDHYSSGSATQIAVEPRISVVYSLRRSLRLVHAFGIAHQPPSFIVPVPGFQMARLDEGLQRSLQSSAGVEWDLPNHFSATGTLFQNAFFNLTDPISSMTLDRDLDDFAERSRGHALGLELSLRRSFSQRIGGFVTYTLSKSWRSLRQVRFPAAIDRRHVLQAALAFNLGRGWRASTRVMFYTGIPSVYRDDLDEGTESSNGGTSTAVINPEHLPRTDAYYRADLRLQKRWLVGNGGAYWALTFEALNATLNREMINQRCNGVRCEGERVGPITVPSIGVEASY